MQIAVTGATGHVGINVVRALVARGDHVRAIVHSTNAPLHGLDVELVRGDVTDPVSLQRAFHGVEVVIHLAACISIRGSQGGLVERTNVEGARHSAQASAACGVRRHLHMSSVHAYDLTRLPISEENEPARADQPWRLSAGSPRLCHPGGRTC